MNTKIKNIESIIYPDLSYDIVGAAFSVFNSIGFGMNEKFYQEAFAKELEKQGKQYQRERMIEVKYKDNFVKKFFLDFIVDEKIVVELKVKPRFGYVHIRQVLEYLKASQYQLALIVYFTKDGVKYKRILNAS